MDSGPTDESIRLFSASTSHARKSFRKTEEPNGNIGIYSPSRGLLRGAARGTTASGMLWHIPMIASLAPS